MLLQYLVVKGWLKRMEDIPTGLILVEDEETLALETETLLGAVTEPPPPSPEERGGATQAVASQHEEAKA